MVQVPSQIIRKIYFANASCIVLFYILGHVAISTSDHFRTNKFKNSLAPITRALLFTSISGVILFIFLTFLTTFFIYRRNSSTKIKNCIA